MDKTKTNLFAVFFIMTFAGCATVGLWSKPYYYENVSHALISSDSKTLVFLGDKYHYVFDDSENLKDLLQWDGRKMLSPILSGRSDITLDNNNYINGNILIKCNCDNASKEQIEWLEQQGFTHNIFFTGSPAEEKDLFAIDIHIKGKRYRSNTPPLSNITPLNEKYTINIQHKSHSAQGVITRATLTPLTVALDGAATISIAGVVLLFSPFILVEEALDK